VSLYALDTSTLVDYFRGRGRTAERMLATPVGQILLPTVVLYELEVGVAKSADAERRRAELAELAGALRLAPFGAEEARTAARIRATLEARGESIGPHDVLIAATAQACGAVLVTHNKKEFARVDGLRIDDWF
jgi:tRNA(fMet)-specific endonuclease VapC